MARIDVDGLELDYELIGPEGGRPLVVTPGGRYPRDSAGVPELGQVFADRGYRVLLWDRPGCGASDVAFTAASESAMNAAALAGLVARLGLRDIRMIGGSAGSRITLLAAMLMPQNVEKIAVWWITGGPVGLAQIGWYYYGDQVNAAAKGGMAAVAALPSWAEQTRRNPRIRDILLAQEPKRFIATLQRWCEGMAYDAGSPLPGVAVAEFQALTMPILVFRSGESDMAHPRRTSEHLHEVLPNATMQEPPWPDQEWNNVSEFPIDVPNRRGRFERWPLIAPPILAFFDG